MERSNITEPNNVPAEHSEHPAGSTLRKRKTLTISVPRRLEGLAVVAVSIATIVFLGMSGHTLYQFPVPDSYRWYGDETWLLTAWKNLLIHGRMVVPIAMQSQLMRAPGLVLGSNWFTAIWYGIPQLIIAPQVDPITVGRTVTFIIALITLGFLAYFGTKLQIFSSILAIVIALVATTRTFTLGSHSARYDMITGFALLAFVAFFALRIHSKGDKARESEPLFSFLFGLAALVTGMTISPHVGGLLLLPSIYIAWHSGIFRGVANIFSAVVGAVLGLALLAVAYALANHNVPIFGIAAGSNESNSYLSHLPILHPFSWSAQRHQLGAKLYYLWHDAPAFAFALPLIFISEIVLTIREVHHPVARFLTVSLAWVLVGSAFFQSTLPYYMLYFVPLAALALAAQIMEWSKNSWLLPLLAAGSLVLIVEMLCFWLPELSNAGRIGIRINESNAAAVQAAIEEASRTWEPGSPKPLVLAQGPALHELLRDTNLRVMNESFIFFPLRAEGESPDSVIAHAGVNYIMDYNKPMTREYQAMVLHGMPIFTRTGPLLDRTVNYFHDTTSELDTLTLYEVNSQ